MKTCNQQGGDGSFPDPLITLYLILLNWVLKTYEQFVIKS